MNTINKGNILIAIGMSILTIILISFLNLQTEASPIERSLDLTLINNTKLPSIATVITGYAYLVEGDILDFSYSFDNVIEWCINITLTDIVTEEPYTYYSCGTESKPITPIFKTPSTGFYRIRIAITNYRVSKITGKAYITLSIKATDPTTKYTHLLSTTPPLLVASLLLVILGLMSSLVRIKNTVLLAISRELTDTYRTFIPLFAVITVPLIHLRVYSEYLIVGPAIIEETSNIPFTNLMMYLHDKVAFHYDDPMLKYFIYLVYAIVLVSLIFTYEDESKVIRTKLLVIDRRVLITSKLLALIILVLTPLAIMYFGSFYIVNPRLVLHNPLLYIAISLSRLLYDFAILVFLTSITLLVSVIVRRVQYSTLITLLILITLPYSNTILSKQQILESLTLSIIPRSFLSYYQVALMISSLIIIVALYKLMVVRDYD